MRDRLVIAAAVQENIIPSKNHPHGIKTSQRPTTKWSTCHKLFCYLSVCQSRVAKVPCSAEFFSNIFKQFSKGIKNRQRRATYKTFHRNAALRKNRKKNIYIYKKNSAKSENFCTQSLSGYKLSSRGRKEEEGGRWGF